MYKKAVFYIVVVALPLVMFTYFFINVATLTIVRNAGNSDTEISMVIASDARYERTPEKLLKAKSTTLVMFTSQTEGELSVTCTKDGHRREFSVGHASPRGFSASMITLESCDRLISKSGFSL